VERASGGEYGPAVVRVERSAGVLRRLGEGEAIDVWMSHGDRLAELPPGFAAIGSSPGSPLCAVADERARIYGLQFHPEVAHTPRGRDILDAFLFDVARLAPTWTPASFVEEAIEAVRAKTGPTDHAILGLSGGVDSSVAAA